MTFRPCQNDQDLNFELTTRRPRPLAVASDEEDLDPESDASLLRKHLDSSEDGLDEDRDANTSDSTHLTFSQRLFAIMSRAPLISKLSAKASTTTYGALATHDPNFDDDPSCPVEQRHKTIEDRDPRNGESIGQDHESNTRSRRTQSISKFATNGLARASSKDDAIPNDEGVNDRSEDDPADNSRYPQVRASVSATDNLSASISTPRMWTLSLLCALLGSGTNLFFSLRYPSVAITPVIALVVVHPLGLAWDKLFKRDGDPAEIYNRGSLQRSSDHGLQATTRKLTRLRRWLAQGSWNEKEHACVYISSNVSFGFAFATDVSNASASSLKVTSRCLHR